jgi:catechol 2,3-dioxygenase-like lactoylglutathione lyase family enzyme
MLGYVTIGTNDLARAGTYYDKFAGEFGYQRIMDNGRVIAWGDAASGKIGVIAAKPADGAPASVGNGMMVALAAKDRAQVDKLYAMAREMGCPCEGPPGERFPGFYAAYWRDLDGNKLNAFVMGAPAS